MAGCRHCWSPVSVAVLLLAHLICFIYPVNAELLAVYAISRHGARNVLPKSANLSEASAFGGATLLPQGRQQGAEAGAAFRERYLAATCGGNSPATCLGSAPGALSYGMLALPGVGFSNYNTLARSSALDRTLLTGAAFLSGAFPDAAANASARQAPPAAAPPMYSTAEPEDYVIRGYSRCPAYQRRLDGWFQSPQFKAKEAETAEFRQRIAATSTPALNASLANWYNVYDGFSVYRTYGVGTPMPNISDADYEEVKALANWLETSKMSSALTGNMLGGAMLADMGSYMTAAVDAIEARTAAPYYSLLYTSAHYNTQLGVLSAMGLDTYAPAAAFRWLSHIPTLAGVMVFELHGTGSTNPALTAGGGNAYAVRLAAQDGPASNYSVVPLPCASEAGAAVAGQGACTWEQFAALAQRRGLATVGDWCAACDNTAVTACKLRPALGANAIDAGGSEAASCGDNGVAWKVAVTAVTCFFGALALAALAWWLLGRRQRARGARQPQLLPGTLGSA